jgi:hypothetical protein
MSGLIASQRTRSGIPDNSTYYILKGQAIDHPALVAPIDLLPDNKSTTANILVEGANGAYKGALTFNPGANSTIPAVQPDGLTLRAVAGGVQVEVGTDGQAVNNLKIAGADGLSSVYDELYNQPVSLSPITQVQTAPLLTPDNDEEVLRCVQAGIAAAIATPGSQFNIFSVPKTGAYMIQTEVAIGNATSTNTVVIPSTVVGGVPIWKSISLGFQVQGTVQAIPYASFEILGGDFYGEQAFAANGLITKTFTSVAFLTAGINYAVTLNCDAGWNIGSGGQIKTELITMC